MDFLKKLNKSYQTIGSHIYCVGCFRNNSQTASLFWRTSATTQSSDNFMITQCKKQTLNLQIHFGFFLPIKISVPEDTSMIELLKQPFASFLFKNTAETSKAVAGQRFKKIPRQKSKGRI